MTPGFPDAVAGAQSSFRALLDALARPGTRHRAGADLDPPAPLDRATAAVLLTLVDADSCLWLDPAFAAAASWIAFHCGPRLTADLAAADFVVTPTLATLATLATGTDEAPEDSATLILQLPGLDAGPELRLSGPGLRIPTILQLGLPTGFARAWAANHALFPRGIDLILCAGSTLTALPRSLRVEETG